MLTTGPHIRFFERHTLNLFRPTLVKAIKAYRWGTRNLRIMPDFIIIGARKCGTTSLYEYLIQHPCVLPALSKELYYFDYHYEKGVPWYSRHFPTKVEKVFYAKALGRAIITGEATPSYFYNPVTASRIAQALPQAKLILLLREPIAAAYSAYQFGLKKGTYTSQEVKFEEIVKAEINYIKKGGVLFENREGVMAINQHCSLLARHVYVELLRPWFATFDRRQIKVLLSEDLFSNPVQTCNEVHEFLGLPNHELETYPRFNENHYSSPPPQIEFDLQNFYAPFNERLSNFLGLDVATKWGYAVRSQPQEASNASHKVSTQVISTSLKVSANSATNHQ